MVSNGLYAPLKNYDCATGKGSSLPGREAPAPTIATPKVAEDYCALDEKRNILGAGKCSSDGECKGARTCASSGMCSGDHKCIYKPKPTYESKIKPRTIYTGPNAKEINKFTDDLMKKCDATEDMMLSRNELTNCIIKMFGAEQSKTRAKI